MKKNSIFTLSTLLLLASCGGGGTSITPTTSVDPVTSSPSVTTSMNVPEEDNKVHLIILTGQSGARGKALNSHLTEEQKETNDEVDIMAAKSLKRFPLVPKLLNWNLDSVIVVVNLAQN